MHARGWDFSTVQPRCFNIYFRSVQIGERVNNALTSGWAHTNLVLSGSMDMGRGSNSVPVRPIWLICTV